MASGGTYLEGSTVKLEATFEVNNVKTDPTTVTLKVLSPAGVTSTYTYALGQVTKSATGVYYKYVTLDAPGRLVYRFIGTGTAAGVNEAGITVTPSVID